LRFVETTAVERGFCCEPTRIEQRAVSGNKGRIGPTVRINLC
jgi:hypothetical protein